MNEHDRYAVARLIGRLTHLESGSDRKIMLIGPGRWGTRMPSLGVPVSFNEINTVAVLCEINTMHEGLVPDLSLGTHFFNEMVEMDMLYLALFSTRGGNRFHEKRLRAQPNRLAHLCPEETAWGEAVRVVDAESLPAGRGFFLNADALKQGAFLYTAAHGH